MRNNLGFTLLELTIVLIVASVLVSAVAINLSPSLVSLNIEQVSTQVAANISRTREEALRGNPNSKPLEFNKDPMSRTLNLKDATAGNHTGIFLTDQSPKSKSHCESRCSSREQLLCISGQPFCYTPSKSFTFERFSGGLPTGYAIFIKSKTRNLAVIVNASGKTDIIELINGEWKAKAESYQIRN